MVLGLFSRCFHGFIGLQAFAEASDLSRKPAEVSALSGYAGGKEVGGKGEVCYHNMAMAPDYGRMGHTEVVNVDVPEGKVTDFAKARWRS